MNNNVGKEEDTLRKALKNRIHFAQKELEGNESLFDSLNEDGAKAMLKFGYKNANEIAKLTLGLNDLEAETAMTNSLITLKKVMRRLALLIGNFDKLSDDDRLWMWDSVIANSREIIGDQISLPPLEGIIDLIDKGSSTETIISYVSNFFQFDTV